MNGMERRRHMKPKGKGSTTLEWGMAFSASAGRRRDGPANDHKESSISTGWWYMEYHTYPGRVDCVEIEYTGPECEHVPSTEAGEESWSADARGNLEHMVSTWFKGMNYALLRFPEKYKEILAPIIEKEGFTPVQHPMQRPGLGASAYQDQDGRDVNFYKPVAPTSPQRKEP
jgi:hypothetical protein